MVQILLGLQDLEGRRSGKACRDQRGADLVDDQGLIEKFEIGSAAREGYAADQDGGPDSVPPTRQPANAKISQKTGHDGEKKGSAGPPMAQNSRKVDRSPATWKAGDRLVPRAPRRPGTVLASAKCFRRRFERREASSKITDFAPGLTATGGCLTTFDVPPLKNCVQISRAR